MIQSCHEGWMVVWCVDLLMQLTTVQSNCGGVVVTTWAEAHLADLGHHAWSAELLIATPWSLCANCGMDCYGHWISALLWSRHCGDWLCSGLRGLCLSHCPDLSLSMCTHISHYVWTEDRTTLSRPTETQIQSLEVRRIEALWIQFQFVSSHLSVLLVRSTPFSCCAFVPQTSQHQIRQRCLKARFFFWELPSQNRYICCVNIVSKIWEYPSSFQFLPLCEHIIIFIWFDQIPSACTLFYIVLEAQAVGVHNDTSFLCPVQLCQAPGGLVSGVYQKPSSNLVGVEDHDEITCSAKTGISKLPKQNNWTELELATSLPRVGQ